MTARILTAAVLLVAFVSALFLLPRGGWALLCLALLAIASWEWARLAGLGGAGGTAYSAACVALAAGLDWATTEGAKQAIYLAAAVFWLGLVPLWLWQARWRPGRALKPWVGFLALIPAFVALRDLREANSPKLLAIMITLWISDTAAYFVGRSLGRHKLAPAISPGKTWEGAFGALAAVMLYAFAWASLVSAGRLPPALAPTPLAPAALVPSLMLLAVAGILGDLLKSLLKREAGVKDSGTLLPGHGGLLDRIDSLTAALPLAALALGR